MSRLQPALAAPTPDSRLFALADGARYLTLDTRLEKAAGKSARAGCWPGASWTKSPMPGRS
ncbi:hypothetical protein NMC42_10680 [Pseudomonas aeruginosa]|nr:hypothetical protein [Pseudomonas aeruginosa]